jgi:hypothetical protein
MSKAALTKIKNLKRKRLYPVLMLNYMKNKKRGKA